MFVTSNYFTIRVPKQVCCNYTATIPWKYKELINKMSC
jgi:hypothetical protein